jgi:ABC-type transport system involved in multi-copper enzyme maturation permease subunit
MKIIAIAGNTFRETMRDKIFYNLLIFYIAMVSLSILLGGLSIGEDEKIIKDIGLSGMAVFGALITIFIGISLINREIDKRTVYTILSKPVSRADFILGKFAGLSTLVAVNVTFMTFCLLLVLFGVTGKFDHSLLIPLPFMFVEFLLLAALAIMFSSFSTPTLSAIFTLSLYILGHLSPQLRDISLTGASVLSRVASVIYRIIPNLENLNLREEVVYSLQVDWSLIMFSVLYGIVYTAFLLTCSIYIFGRRDLR